MPEDFRAAIEAANKTAIDDANKKSGADEELAKIMQQASQLEAIFSQLQLTDPATYQKLVDVVEDATAKNESVANVINRLKALGAAGKNLAMQIGNVASGGPIAMLRTALNLKLPA
jgi:division protein CdvB (Snf7/Vps24/ESCRT-III family)